MTEIITCKVKNCRFYTSHTTSGHLCGKCGKFGHGQIECGNHGKIDYLSKYNDEIMPVHIQCSFNGCLHKHNHIKDAHHCHKCLRKHSPDDCIIQTYDKLVERYGFEGTLQNFDITNFRLYHQTSPYPKSYTKIFLGMGCCAFIRNINGEILTIFMHSDSWGQYGHTSSDLPIYVKFIEDCTEIQSTNNNSGGSIVSSNVKKCPLCRTENDISKIVDIKGNTQECSVCMDNAVEKFFSECSHACVCNECYEKL